MNKYQMAYNYLLKRLGFLICENISELIIIRKLVEKTVPMKATLVDDGVGFGDKELCCPSCITTLYNTPNYCPHCGQALDWSDNK